MGCLTRTEAATRAEQVTVESYTLDVDLTGGDDSFTTETTVRFAAAVPGAETFVEVRPRVLRAATLNGVALDPATLRDGRLRLPDLAPHNQLTVTAEFEYSRASEGMHRFVDPADGEVYVYAQPAITQAPRFMACFDQPDLKAPVTLRVDADPRWLVRANGEGKQTAAGRWEFAPTPPLATYLITVAAGPFHQVSGEHDGIPLGLFARSSLAAHLETDAEELLEITAGGLARYHELFGVRYPFGKYDQVFAPEFSWGAMEFPGCVLVRDEHIFRSAVTETEREARAVLIMHEMAHMWFGDLVTMRWWDDLWLNESFADYAGWRVAAEVTRWRTAWTTYSLVRKSWGYAADQRPSTHPVAPAEVVDTDAALANFDGISYAKGSAVLRQLVATLGDDAFRAGLRSYFDAHAYGNATLADLLAALSRAGGRDLTGWADAWLRQSNVDILAPEVRTGPDGRWQEVALGRRTPDPGSRLRPYQVSVGRYGEIDGEWVRQERFQVELPGTPAGSRAPVPGLAGAEPGLLLVNDDDLAYAKVRLLPGQRDRLPEVLPRVADPLARAVLWCAAFDTCRDAELPAGRFVALVAAGLPTETQVTVFSSILEWAREVAVGQFLPPVRRPAAWAALAGICRPLVAEPGPRQLAAARGLIAAGGAADTGWLREWLSGGTPPGLAMDADLRWAVLGRLSALGAVTEGEIDAELARDRSARGEQAASWCRAARPDPAAKAAAWRLLATDRILSNRLLVAAAEGFWQPDQAELTAGYVERYFTELPATAQWRSEQMLTRVARSAYPRFAVSTGTLDTARARLAAPGLHPVLRREIVDATDDLTRALAARAVAEEEPR